MLQNHGTTYSLAKTKGYENAINELNNICKIYGYGKNIIDARSINLNDISKLDSLYTLTDKTYTKESDGYIYVDGTKTSMKNFAYYNNESNAWPYLEIGDSITYKQPTGKVLAFISNKIIKSGSSGQRINYFIADNSTYYSSSSFAFGIPVVETSNVIQINPLCYPDKITSTYSTASSFVRPVLTLSSSVQLGEKIDGVWQLEQK